jgi:tetratricopeptide (TPR) repeat protein
VDWGGGEMSPERATQLQEETAVYRRLSQWQKTVVPIRKLHAAFPDNHIYVQQLAEAYGHLGRFREEAEMWERFLDIAPLPAEGCPQIGQAYEKQGLIRKAIGAFERCMKVDNDSGNPIFFLAHALEHNGEIERAAELYARGMQRYPRYWDLAVGLARTRLRQGSVAEARRAIEPVILAAPDNVDALLVIGIICRREGNRVAARKYLTRGVELAAGYTDFHALLGRIEEEDGNLAAAIDHYTAAAKAEGWDGENAQRLQLLGKARQ